MFLAWENSQHFEIPPLFSLENNIWGRSTEIPFSLMTRHYPDLGSAWSCNIFASTELFEAKFPRCTTNQKLCPDLGSDTSSFWNFSTLGKPVVSAKVSCFLRASLTFCLFCCRGREGGGDKRSARVKFSVAVATKGSSYLYTRTCIWKMCWTLIKSKKKNWKTRQMNRS